MSDKESEPQDKEPILVSACLLGLPTRYDGKTKTSQHVLDYLKRENLIPVPVCPEQLAGMSTPRDKTFFKSGNGQDVLKGTGDVVSESGQSMNEVFCKGAKITLEIARLSGCQKALLKERSPSCGVHQIYQGDKKVSGMGITSALLQNAGIDVKTETEL